METLKVAIMTFGDPRDHEWKSFISNYAIPRHKQAIEFFENKSLEVIALDSLPRSNKEIDEQVEYFKSQGAEAFIAHTSTWSWPSMVVRAVQKMDLPTVLLGNDHPGTASTVGLLGSGGALDQIGYPHLRILNEFDDSEDSIFETRVLPYLRAASSVKKLHGRVMGFYGGRSLGIDTGSHDPMQWKKQFGVDTDHVDQLEIIRRAEEVDADRIEKMEKWLTGNVRKVNYNEKLTDDKLRFQIACYLATKDIIEENGHDFVAIKCMPDLTSHYVPQCMSACFLPAPFDAEGEKETVGMACEADADGALAMEVLKLVSGGIPPMFGDMSNISPKDSLFYIPNCGAINAWYATRENDAEKNLSNIELRPANRPAGGAIPFMEVANGEITLARFYRKNGKYHMGIIVGDVITPEHDLYEAYKKSRGEHQLPTAFVKADVDFDKLINNFGSNHISGVAGNWEKELLYACEMLDVVPELFNI